MKIIDTANRRRIQRQLLGLVPPVPRTLNITNGKKLASDIKEVVRDYANATKLDVEAFTDVLATVPYRQSIYSDFLIHSSSIHNDERLGTPLFKFTDGDPKSTIDIVFTTQSLFSLFESIRNNELYPKLKRMSMLLYDTHSGLNDLVPNLNSLIENKTFHKCIMPVGFLTENMHSTFLNKITSVMKGPILSKKEKILQTHKVVIPSEIYLDLDHWLGPANIHDTFPVPSYAVLYFVLVYLVNGPEFLFVKSMKSKCQVMNALRQYFCSQIINSFDSLGGEQELDISKMAFGAITRLGLLSTLDDIKHGSLNFKTSSLPVVEIEEFVAEVSTWDILI